MRSLVLLAAAAVLGAACSAPIAAQPVDAREPETSVTAAAPTAVPDPLAVVPLTGEQTTDLGVLDRPVVAAKIENSAAARPQSGLDVADIVYEELVEGGVTRFIALFQSEVPEAIGPVRSARPEDAGILPAYDALLIYSGARPEVVGQLQAAGVALTIDGDRGFYRDSSRGAPHNLYARGAEVFATAAARALAPATAVGWTFAAEPGGGDATCADDDTGCDAPGAGVTLPLSDEYTTAWDYDAAAGVYRRSQNGEPSAVTGTGRVGAANVVLLATDVGAGGCCDTSGAPYVATRVVGEGRAVLLRDGRWYEGRWVKAGADDQLRLSDASGAPLVLAPGPTWLHLAPGANLPDAPDG